jgi:hypothetical protein
MIANHTARDLIESIEELLRVDNLKVREAEKVRGLARARVKDARAEIQRSHVEIIACGFSGGGK